MAIGLLLLSGFALIASAGGRIEVRTQGGRGSTFDREKAIVRATVERVVAWAQRSGRADPELAWADVVLLIEANARIAALGGPDREATARRLVRHFLRSFSATIEEEARR